MLLPLFVPLAVLSPLAGWLTARHGPRPALLAGALLGDLRALPLRSRQLGLTEEYDQLRPVTFGLAQLEYWAAWR